jgi:hypothetical protein
MFEGKWCICKGMKAKAIVTLSSFKNIDPWTRMVSQLRWLWPAVLIVALGLSATGVAGVVDLM